MFLSAVIFCFSGKSKGPAAPGTDAYDIILPGALGVVIGARLGHILFYKPWILLEDPIWVFKIYEGGLASHGATLGIVVALVYYARVHRLPFWECSDRFMFSVTLAAIMVRLGNFLNSEIVGRVTDGSWGVRFPLFDGPLAPYRHPSQLYEAGMGLVVMALLFLADAAFGREKRPRGLLSGVFLTSYFTGRFLVEYVKEYQVMPAGNILTMGQMLSIPAALSGVLLLSYSLYRKTPAKLGSGTPAPGKSRVEPKQKKSQRGLKALNAVSPCPSVSVIIPTHNRAGLVGTGRGIGAGPDL